MNDTKERPILFSAEMVKAILREENPKTMTRRIIKPQPEWRGSYWLYQDEVFMTDEAMQSHLFHNVYGDKGTPYGAIYGDGTADRLWVKETWQAYTPNGRPYSDLTRAEKDQAELCNWAVVSKATNPEDKRDIDPWIPSIFMPRWASAMVLEITDVGIERLQEISEIDAAKEGVEPMRSPSVEEGWQNCNLIYKPAFTGLWDSINSKREHSFESNPWVWVIEFKRVGINQCSD
jgi:hypothetical protein